MVNIAILMAVIWFLRMHAKFKWISVLSISFKRHAFIISPDAQGGGIKTSCT